MPSVIPLQQPLETSSSRRRGIDADLDGGILRSVPMPGPDPTQHYGIPFINAKQEMFMNAKYGLLLVLQWSFVPDKLSNFPEKTLYTSSIIPFVKHFVGFLKIQVIGGTGRSQTRRII